METKPHVCPVWIGYLMNSPLRKLQQDPDKILGPYIMKGMKILEIGPAMGYFSIPMARMAGSEGMLYCVDIQQNMLKKLEERALKKEVLMNIQTIQASSDSQNIEHLENRIDFCLLAFVVHEIPDQTKFFSEIAGAMKKRGKVLLVEPRMHVKEDDWNRSLSTARENGFSLVKEVRISGSRAFELMRN